jgi:hypothetical protein
MSDELVDFRCKITPETATWLQAAAHARRSSMSEVARDEFHRLAQERLHESIIAARMMVGKGYVGAVQGLPRMADPDADK